MSQLGDALRAEAAIADRPGQMDRLEAMADEADELVANVAQARRNPAVRNAQRYLETREELRRHARMRHPEGRAFHGACTCGGFVGPNSAFNDHVASEITRRLEREDL